MNSSGMDVPLQPLSIALDDLPAYRPGQPIRGYTAWSHPAPPGPIDIRLFFYTTGIGTRDVEVVATRRIDNPPALGRERFEFIAPASPYSFSGTLITLMWAVEAVEHGGRHAARQELLLGPRGLEVRLANLGNKL